MAKRGKVSNYLNSFFKSYNDNDDDELSSMIEDYFCDDEDSESDGKY